MNEETADRARRIYRQTGQVYAKHYLEFARQHRSDFGMLELELENIQSGMNICLGLQDFGQFAEYFDIISSYLVERTNGNDFLEYARLILKRNLLRAEQVAILGQMAEVEEDRGNYGEARKIYRQQLEKVKNDIQDNNKGIIYRIFDEIARLAVLQADYVDAKHALDDKLGVAQKRGNYKEQVNALHELGRLQVNMGNLNDADALCSKGIEISRQIEYLVGETNMLMLQGSIQFGMRKFGDSIKLYQEALRSAAKMKDQSRANEIRSHLEELNMIMGKQIFISYSHHDRGFVERLVNDLKAAGLSVWWDELEIKVGHSIIKKVSEGIGKSAFLAVALSPKSVKSDFVQHELESALIRQLSGKKIRVLPLLISDCKIPTFLQVLKWADFRKSYESGFRELLDRLSNFSTDD